MKLTPLEKVHINNNLLKLTALTQLTKHETLVDRETISVITIGETELNIKTKLIQTHI